MEKRIELGSEQFLRDRQYLADDDIVYRINEDDQSVTVYQSDYRITKAIIASEVVIEGMACPVSNFWKCAFYECLDMLRVVIPDSVKNIGDETFAKCFSLEKIIINNASLLKNAELPENQLLPALI